MRSFEDFTTGETVEYGPLTVTADDIKAFAAAYDPQPMHLNEAAAQNTIAGGLLASGMHTICLHMRLLVDGLLHDTRSEGSPGVDEVRFLAPVRPGDRLTLRFEIIELRPSRSRPQWGFLKFRSHMVNHDGTAVMRMVSTIIVGRRGSGAVP
jgi:acyl dehydratase